MLLNKISKYLLLFILCFGLSFVYAREDNPIVLTAELIKSSEKCPVVSRELNCKSYRQTTNYTCGPATVMTLMRYYRMLGPKDMNQATELRIAAEMSASPGSDGGTTTSQVASWLSQHGFSVNSGSRISTDFLIENLQRGHPILLAYNKHWLLAKGYNKGSTPDEDEIICSDSCCNVTILTRASIDGMWQESQLLANNRCIGNVGNYIVAVPR